VTDATARWWWKVSQENKKTILTPRTMAGHWQCPARTGALRLTSPRTKTCCWTS